MSDVMLLVLSVLLYAVPCFAGCALSSGAKLKFEISALSSPFTIHHQFNVGAAKNRKRELTPCTLDLGPKRLQLNANPINSTASTILYPGSERKHCRHIRIENVYYFEKHFTWNGIQPSTRSTVHRPTIRNTRFACNNHLLRRC